MAETQAEFYARKAREEAERQQAAQEISDRNHMRDVLRNPGMYSPQERLAMQRRNFEQESSRRFDETQRTARGQWGYTDEYGVHHAGGAEKVAEYDWMGKRDAGSVAAGINAEATKYGADKNLAGVEAQAKSALEIAKEKAEAEKWIAGKSADVTDAGSKREWGYTDEQGNYHPGGRVAQAQAQGEAAAKMAEQNNQARIEQERIKAQAKVQAQQIMSTNNIQKAVAGNPVMARLMQNQIEAWIAEGKTQEQINEEVAAMQQSGQGTDTTQQPAGNARTQSIRNTYQQRGLGV